MSNFYETATVTSVGKHTSTLVFLHGLGESGHIWANKLNKTLRKENLKIICLTAPKIPFTLYKNVPMTAFINVLSSDINAKEDESSILSAVDRIHEISDEELAKTRLPSKKLMLGGYSQGGTVALYAALTYHKPLAGVICLSSWLPLRYSMPGAIVNNFNVPILHCHGIDDPIITHELVNYTMEILTKVNPNYQLVFYKDLKHTVNEKELADIKVFIHNILK